MKLDELQSKFRQAPRHHKIVAGVAVAVVLLVALKLLSSGPAPQHSYTPSPDAASTTTPPGMKASRRAPTQASPDARAAPAPAVAFTAASPDAASTAATASAIPSAPAAPIAPPADIAAGWVRVAQLGKDQFGQWLSLGSTRSASLPTLDLRVPTPPAGSSGTRRTTYTAWFRTAEPVQTVTLHLAGGGARVSAEIDQHWSLSASHSGWSDGATQQQTVVALAPGWHSVTVTADRTPNKLDRAPVAVELQLGSGDTNPVVPVPWAVPAPRAPKAAKPASATSAAVAKPAAAPARVTKEPRK